MLTFIINLVYLRTSRKEEDNVMKNVSVEKLNVMTLVAPIIIAIIIIIISQWWLAFWDANASHDCFLRKINMASQI